MPPTFCEGGTVLVTGLRFDFGRVLEAYVRVIDAMTARFPGEARVTPAHQGFADFDWPDPGKAEALEIWKRMAGIYDAVDEPLVHVVGGFTIKAFLLGKTWCVYDRTGDELHTPTREDISKLDPAPMLCFYGPAEPGRPNAYNLLESAQLDAIQAVIEGPLADLGLEWLRRDLPVERRTGRTLGIAFARLPHERYGDGIGPIRVRCIETDGRPVPKNTTPD